MKVHPHRFLKYCTTLLEIRIKNPRWRKRQSLYPITNTSARVKMLMIPRDK